MSSEPERKYDQEDRPTIGEAAQALGVSDKSVRGLIRSGELTAYRPTSRKTWVLRPNLAAFWVSSRILPLERAKEGTD
jgi:excisionase family DNA binding protein